MNLVPVQLKANSGQFTINSNTEIALLPQNQEMENAVAVFNNSSVPTEWDGIIVKPFSLKKNETTACS